MQGGINFGKSFDSCRASFADRWVGNRCPTLTVLLPASNSIVPKWRRFPIVGLPVRYRLDRVSGKSAVKLDTGSHWTKDSLQCSCVIKIHDDPSLAARENTS